MAFPPKVILRKTQIISFDQILFSLLLYKYLNLSYYTETFLFKLIKHFSKQLKLENIC